ncbi:MAG: hypothetical protein KBC81_01610 [Candidatus Pacebacteria bacterium]|nr:hypothetical protein [Candidatus Paceibacterota bacterium]
MEKLQKIISESGRNLHSQIMSMFFPTPPHVCQCGKPVIFHHPSRKFNCTRCGRNYELIVEVREVV